MYTASSAQINKDGLKNVLNNNKNISLSLFRQNMEQRGGLLLFHCNFYSLLLLLLFVTPLWVDTLFTITIVLLPLLSYLIVNVFIIKLRVGTPFIIIILLLLLIHFIIIAFATILCLLQCETEN